MHIQWDVGHFVACYCASAKTTCFYIVHKWWFFPRPEVSLWLLHQPVLWSILSVEFTELFLSQSPNSVTVWGTRTDRFEFLPIHLTASLWIRKNSLIKFKGVLDLSPILGPILWTPSEFLAPAPDVQKFRIAEDWGRFLARIPRAFGLLNDFQYIVNNHQLSMFLNLN